MDSAVYSTISFVCLFNLLSRLMAVVNFLRFLLLADTPVLNKVRFNNCNILLG